MQRDYLIGLDLGQARDYSALAVVERVWKPHADCAGRLVSHYALRHLRRWPLQTSYTAVAADLAGLVRTPPLSWPVLVVDQTGVGQAVVDFLAKAQLSAWLESVVITSGHGISMAGLGTCPRKSWSPAFRCFCSPGGSMWPLCRSAPCSSRKCWPSA